MAKGDYWSILCTLFSQNSTRRQTKWDVKLKLFCKASCIGESPRDFWLSAMATKAAIAAIVFVGSILAAFLSGAKSIGVCYGMLGDNLPQPDEVVSLYKSHNITRMRLYNPDAATLRALSNSNIQLLLGIPIDIVQLLAANSTVADNWVQENVVAHWPNVSFLYLAVGNEVLPDVEESQHVLSAMGNIYAALTFAGLQNQIKVSTVVDARILASSYPPSSGEFTSAAQKYLSPIVRFLVGTGAPLLLNLYPYFTYTANPEQVSLPYALFTAPGVVIQDGPFGYQNLFDVMLDSVHAALEKMGGSNVTVVVSESGWPSAGSDAANVSNAQTYNQNLINHVGRGTPRRRGRAIETFIFAMFNENQKLPSVEQNFGLFYPNKQPVYPSAINFSEPFTDQIDDLPPLSNIFYPNSNMYIAVSVMPDEPVVEDDECLTILLSGPRTIVHDLFEKPMLGHGLSSEPVIWLRYEEISSYLYYLRMLSFRISTGQAGDSSGRSKQSRSEKKSRKAMLKLGMKPIVSL